jgi:hypothetical protein
MKAAVELGFGGIFGRILPAQSAVRRQSLTWRWDSAPSDGVKRNDAPSASFAWQSRIDGLRHRPWLHVALRRLWQRRRRRLGGFDLQRDRLWRRSFRFLRFLWLGSQRNDTWPRPDDVVSGAKRQNSIARSAWPIELHSGQKPRIEWLLDDYYDIAYDNFVPARGDGLLVAGRCLSAEHEAMASARVTAQCFSYGQAIGMVAAMCLRDGTSPRKLNASDLREALRKDGAEI